MYDWNDQDQVGHPLWGEVGEIEDHIVPHSNKEDTLFTFGDYRKKKINEEISSVMRSTEHISGAKNYSPGFNLEDSRCNTNEEFSPSTLEMESWPDLLNLSDSRNNEYSNITDLDYLTKGLMNDLTDEPNLNSVKVQLDGVTEQVSDGQEDNGGGIFLDFGWDTIDDDLNRYFRNNDTISIHDMIGNTDQFLSSSEELISSTAQSIPMPDIPLSNNPPSDQGCSSSQLDEDFDEIRKTLHKEKVDGPSRILRSQKKAEPRSKHEPPQDLTVVWDHNENQQQYVSSKKLHGFGIDAQAIFQSGPVSHLSSSPQVIHSQYRYPTCSVPSIPRVHAESQQKRPVPIGGKSYPDHVKYLKPLEKSTDVLSRPVTMTPQEKIDKLRRRQKMQARLAIQKQQHHYGHHMTGIDDSVSQACSQESQSLDAATNTIGMEECTYKFPSSKTVVEKHDGPKRVSLYNDDKSLEETIYYQLQDSLQKLNLRVRLCIRDSLCRLAKSAVERQSISDRSSTNESKKYEDKIIADEERKCHDRDTRFPPDSETVTNHVDRIVANFLFHRQLESCPSILQSSKTAHGVCSSVNGISKLGVALQRC